MRMKSSLSLIAVLVLGFISPASANPAFVADRFTITPDGKFAGWSSSTDFSEFVLNGIYSEIGQHFPDFGYGGVGRISVVETGDVTRHFLPLRNSESVCTMTTQGEGAVDETSSHVLAEVVEYDCTFNQLSLDDPNKVIEYKLNLLIEGSFARIDIQARNASAGTLEVQVSSDFDSYAVNTLTVAPDGLSASMVEGLGSGLGFRSQNQFTLTSNADEDPNVYRKTFTDTISLDSEYQTLMNYEVVIGFGTEG